MLPIHTDAEVIQERRQHRFDSGDPSGEAQGTPNGAPHGRSDQLGRLAMTRGGWRSNVRLHAERIADMPAVAADHQCP